MNKKNKQNFDDWYLDLLSIERKMGKSDSDLYYDYFTDESRKKWFDLYQLNLDTLAAWQENYDQEDFDV